MVTNKTFELAGDIFLLENILKLSEVTEENHKRVQKMVLFLSSKMLNEEETKTDLNEILDYLEKKYL